MKSKGLYAGIAIDGTIIIERTDENEKFYGERISVSDILAGKIRHPPDSIKTLHQTIKAAQGDSDVDEDLVPPPGETPGDVELQETQGFGIPDAEDPDPYGVKALEAEGLFIREAGTKVRPAPDAFEFRPNPGSPVYATFARRSLESSPRNSWRASVQSYTTRGTQTDDAPLTATTSVSRTSSRSAKESTGIPSTWDDAQWDTVPIHGGERDAYDTYEEHQNHESEDEVEVHEVNSVTMSRPESKASSPVEETDSRRMSPNFTRARLVTIPKRPTPPALPPRHPRHTWGSGSSRESTSPTALSHSSRSTEPTETTVEPEAVETLTKPTALPSNVKMLQANTVLPAVVHEDDDDLLDESDSELPADKDEFLSANGDNLEEEQTMTQDLIAAETKEETDRTGSVSAVSAKSENTIGPKDDAFAENLDESLHLVELEDKVREEKFGDAPATAVEKHSNVKSREQDISNLSAEVA